MSAKRFLISLLIVLFLSCDSEDPEFKDVNFSISYTSPGRRVRNYEVNILSTSNKILYQGIVPTATNNGFHVVSPTERVNVVMIDTLQFPEGGALYNIRAYLHVLPGNWDMNFYYETDQPTATVGGSLSYVNLPPTPDENFYFANTAGNDRSRTFSPEENSVTFLYDKPVDDDYTYLLIPALSKYKFVKAGSSDVIDLSEMESALQAKFPDAIAQLSPEVTLTGYPEELNFSKKIGLYSSNLPFDYSAFDYIIPPDHFAHYELFFNGSGHSSWHEYYALSDTPPTTIDVFNETDNTVIQEDQSVEFSFKGNPTLVYMRFVFENVQERIYMHMDVTCPPEVGSVNSSKLIKAIQSELLPQLPEYPFSLRFFKLVKTIPLNDIEFLNYHFSAPPKDRIITAKTQYTRFVQ